MKKIITLFTFLISISTNAQEQLKKIDSIANSKLSDNDPGLFVGVVKDGKILYEKELGWDLSSLHIKGIE